MDQITQLLAQGRKLEAVRAYRQLTGGSLQQALDAVNALEGGQPLPGINAPQQGAGPDPGADLQERRLAGWEQEALDLVKQNRKLDAIALVRRQTGQNLQDALQTVEALETGWRSRWRPLPPTGDPVRDLLQQGRKLEAMKLYMAQHRTGLKQTKDAIDALEREMGLR
jgi:ribosomal protein L7/L12